MSSFPYDVNTPDGRAIVRELVAQGSLPRVPLSTEVVAAQLDIPHDDLSDRWLSDEDWMAILRRLGIDEADEQRSSRPITRCTPSNSLRPRRPRLTSGTSSRSRRSRGWI